MEATEQLCPELLSPRERAVVALLEQGYPEWLVARELSVKLETVRRYASQAAAKAGSEVAVQRSLLTFHRTLS